MINSLKDLWKPVCLFFLLFCFLNFNYFYLREAKKKLAQIIKKQCGVLVDPEALFDVQVKRLHEYKRQTLNILRCIHEYYRLLALGEQCEKATKKVVIFGGKAGFCSYFLFFFFEIHFYCILAPGYFMAKRTIRLITCVGNVVNNDPRIKDRLKVVFVPNYKY
jgi:starch phosphorylase